MRLFKLSVTGLILAFIGLFFWQNAGIFKAILSFSLDLYIREPLQWKHHLYTTLFFAGFLGFLAGICVMLKPYFNIRRLLAQERQQRLPLRALAPPLPVEENIEMSS